MHDPGDRSIAGKVELVEQEGRTSLHIAGPVKSDPTGAVQARRSLIIRRRPLDAHLYAGIRLMAKGNGETYAVQLRTKDTRYRSSTTRPSLRPAASGRRSSCPSRTSRRWA